MTAVSPTVSIGSAPPSPGPAIEPGDIQALWTAEPGWDFEGLAVMGDADGDGVTDIAIWLVQYYDDTGAYDLRGHVQVVPGLPREGKVRVFPDPTLPFFQDVDLIDAGDVDGDGLADLILATDADPNTGTLFVGPFEGEYDPKRQRDEAVGQLPSYHWGDDLSDVDDDGLLDFLRWDPEHPHAWELWFGPLARTSAADPHVIIQAPGCASLGSGVEEAIALPDVTGDGRPEVQVVLGEACGSHTEITSLPPTLPAVVDFTDEKVGTRTQAPLVAVSDQNGDGLSDLWAVGEHEVTFIASPVTLIDSIQGSAHDVLPRRGYPLGIDIDGSGLQDFLGFHPDFGHDVAEVWRAESFADEEALPSRRISFSEDTNWWYITELPRRWSMSWVEGGTPMLMVTVKHKLGRDVHVINLWPE